MSSISTHAHERSRPSKLSSLLLALSCVMSAGVSVGVGEVYAQLSFQITSPVSNTCVPSSTPVQLQGDLTAPPELTLSEVPIAFSITEPNADPVTLSATLNGAPVTLSQDTVQPSAPGVAEELNFIYIPAESISDGVGHVLTLTATSPAGSVSDSVTFDLDRLPPLINFNAQDLALLSSCEPNALTLLNAITPSVSDQYDQIPTLTSEVIDDVCQAARTWSAKDHCGVGNELQASFIVNKPAPQPAQISFVDVDPGGAYLEATPYFEVSVNEQCYQLEGTMVVDGVLEDAFVATNGGPYSTPGDYQLTVTATDCSGVSSSNQIGFRVIEPPTASAGGPYVVTQGQSVLLDGSGSQSPPELGGFVEHAWDLNLDDPFDLGYGYLGETLLFETYNPTTGANFDDGELRVGLRVMTAQGQIEYAETTLTILDAPPTCDAGGPYQALQGEGVLVDASGSSAGVPSEPIIAYRWLCNDLGLIGSEAYGPLADQHTCVFDEEGVFEVELTVEDLDLSTCTATALVTITDVEPTVSGLTILTPPPYIEGQEVSFSAGATSAGSSAEPLTSFSWAWGDGTPNSLNQPGFELRRPTHAFQESGAFQVCLTVSDGDSPASGCLPIEVQDVSPRARLSGDLFAIEGEPASFSISGTRAGDPADPLTRLELDWGDGVVEQLANLNQTDLTHTFQTDGTLTVTLRAYDEDSFTEATLELYVDDVSPHAVITPLGFPAEEGTTTRWSAAASEAGAPSDPITWYVWDFGDGTVLEGADLVEVEHTWADDGLYTVSLTLGDSDEPLASATDQLVVVSNRAPFNASISAESAQAELGVPMRFEVSYEDVPDDTVSIYWRMGEGSTYNNRAVVSHTYEELGLFTVRAILTDEDGGETEVQYEVEVTPAGPALVLEAPASVDEGETLEATLTVSPATGEQGGIDGPVSLRVARAPFGMRWEELAATAEGVQRFRFVWPTSAGDAGEHLLRVFAVPPSGIERGAEVTLNVEEAQEALLVTLGGRPERQLLSIYRYDRDLSRELTSLTEVAKVQVGRGAGRMISLPQQPQRLFVSAPTSSRVGVVSLSTGELLRMIPVSGAPYALAAQGGYLWAFDARDGRVSAIDARLKVTRTLVIPELKGVASAMSVTLASGERLLAHDHDGGLWVLRPEAILSGQVSQAVERAHHLTTSLDAWERAQRGEAPMEGEELLLYTPQRRGAGELSAMGADQVLIKHPRGLVAYNVSALSQPSPEPLWEIKSAAYLRSASLLTPQSEGEGAEGEAPAIWATSSQGLRRFELPTEGLVEGAAGEGELLDLNGYLTLSAGPARLLGEPTVLVGSARSLTHLSATGLRSLLSTPEPSPQQLMLIVR